MSSSISASEIPASGAVRGPSGDASWRRFDRLAVLCALIGALGVYLLLIVADPYDTGRFFSWPVGISDGSPLTANASRGRDPRFNAAVFGNSRGQLLDHARLSALTGRRFVQLTTPGAQPREQLALLHWFKRHHAEIGAIVLVADDTWCTSDPALPSSFPFPFWLYGDGNADYLKSIMRAQAFDRLWRRARIALHLLRPSDPASYANYDLSLTAPVDRRALEQPFNLAFGGEPQAQLPAMQRLRAELADIPSTVPIVIVLPPVFRSALPAHGSPEEARMTRCKKGLADVAASRPGGAFVDFLEDGAIARDPDNFLDHVHYRSNVARTIEQSIAKAIAGS